MIHQSHILSIPIIHEPAIAIIKKSVSARWLPAVASTVRPTISLYVRMAELTRLRVLIESPRPPGMEILFL